MEFPSGDTKLSTGLTINARQPGNNFIVMGRGRQADVDAVVFDANGTTLLKKAGGAPVAGTSQTSLLTVWRTLNVEEESMDAPGVGETFGGAGGADDDVDPGDLGGGTGMGDFVQPSLTLLTAQMARAYVQVSVISDPQIDTRHNKALVRNMLTTDYSSDVRDVPSEKEFWTMQVFAAYEFRPANDFDPDGEIPGVAGNTNMADPQGPVNVYLETIRDMSVNYVHPVTGAHTVDAERLRQRAVLHEAIHRFGHPHHDVAVMNYELYWFGTDAQVALTGVLLRRMMVEYHPSGKLHHVNTRAHWTNCHS